MLNTHKTNQWMKIVLIVAGLYNIAWGSLVIFFPTLFFDLLELPSPLYPQIWQCVGMIVGVYGIGYIISAFNPLIHWPIVLVGLLGKIFGPIGFLQAYIMGELPLEFGLIIIFNDLIWWPFFGIILLKAYRFHQHSPKD